MTNSPVSIARLLAATLLMVALVGCNQSGGLSADAASADEDLHAIRCISVRGDTRFQRSKEFAESLKMVSGVRTDAVQVYDVDGISAVYYGRYVRTYDDKTGAESYRPDPLRDLEMVRSLSLTIEGRAVWPFVHATMAALPTQAGRLAKWDLTNNPGHYSLQIAVFYNTADMRSRKQAAEEYCKILRDQGDEAWYHHGDTNSCVFIGSFPKEAIQASRRENQYSGSVEFIERIVDPKLIATQKKFPHNTHNGATFFEVSVDPKTRQKKREPHTSFAVQVPKRQGTVQP